MSADDNAPAPEAEIGEALVASLGFEPTGGKKRAKNGAGSSAGGGSGGSGTASGTARRSKKSRRKRRTTSRPADASAGGAAGGADRNGGSDRRSTAATSTTKGGDATSTVSEKVAGAAEAGTAKAAVAEKTASATNDIKSAAKPTVSERTTVVVGGQDVDWVSIDEPPAAKSDTGSSADRSEPAPDPEPEIEADNTIVDDTPPESVNGSEVDPAPAASVEVVEDRDAESDADAGDASTDTSAADSTPEAEKAIADEATEIASEIEKAALQSRPSTESTESADEEPPMAAAAAATGELYELLAREQPPAPTLDDAISLDGRPLTEVTPGEPLPSAPPTARQSPAPVAVPDMSPVRTGEIHRVETRDDEIQSARLEAEARAVAEGREVFQRGSLARLFRRSRRLQSRKVRRVVRHVDPWSVLAFSVLFHLCVFAALLLASVLVWNAADATGTIEDVESFITDLGDYETFEIDGEVVFRSAVAIAGILTLTSSVMIVLLTVVFNLISDLIGGIRMTVIEEETVRVRRRKGKLTMPGGKSPPSQPAENGVGAGKR